MPTKTFSQNEIEIFDKDWRDDVKTHSKMEDATATIEFYSHLLKKWLIDNPIETIEEWKESFTKYLEEQKEYIEDFLCQQYGLFHEDKQIAKEKATETATQLHEKASERLQTWADVVKHGCCEQ